MVKTPLLQFVMQKEYPKTVFAGIVKLRKWVTGLVSCFSRGKGDSGVSREFFKLVQTKMFGY